MYSTILLKILFIKYNDSMFQWKNTGKLWEGMNYGYKCVKNFYCSM